MFDHGRNGRVIPSNGEEFRQQPLEDRKRRLAALLHQPHPGVALNETCREDGTTIFKYVCTLGCEGIVSNVGGILPWPNDRVVQ